MGGPPAPNAHGASSMNAGGGYRTSIPETSARVMVPQQKHGAQHFDAGGRPGQNLLLRSSAVAPSTTPNPLEKIAITKKKDGDTINEKVTVVVLLDKYWTEIGCPFCGANATKKRDAKNCGYFFAIKGLHSHIASCHRENFTGTITIKDVRRICARRILSRPDVTALRQDQNPPDVEISPRFAPAANSGPETSLQEDDDAALNELNDDTLAKDNVALNVRDNSHTGERSSSNNANEGINHVENTEALQSTVNRFNRTATGQFARRSSFFDLPRRDTANDAGHLGIMNASGFDRHVTNAFGKRPTREDDLEGSISSLALERSTRRRKTNDYGDGDDGDYENEDDDGESALNE